MFTYISRIFLVRPLAKGWGVGQGLISTQKTPWTTAKLPWSIETGHEIRRRMRVSRARESARMPSPSGKGKGGVTPHRLLSLTQRNEQKDDDFSFNLMPHFVAEVDF